MDARLKLCPMKKDRYCTGEECAWWLEFANDCAVPVAAGILADSTICRNIWEEEEHNAEV